MKSLFPPNPPFYLSNWGGEGKQVAERGRGLAGEQSGGSVVINRSMQTPRRPHFRHSTAVVDQVVPFHAYSGVKSSRAGALSRKLGRVERDRTEKTPYH
jgi:hypothetical protein